MTLRTIKDVYVALLIELNKHKSPSILIEDFNYFWSKATQIYTNKRINISPIGQQVKDDLAEINMLGVPLSPVVLKTNTYPRLFTVILPEDYLHITSCSPEVTVLSSSSSTCLNPTGTIFYPTTKPITSKELAECMQDYYLKPSFSQVYYNIYAVDKIYRLDLYLGNDITKTFSKVFVDYFRQPRIITLQEDDIYETLDNSVALEFSPYINQEIFNELLSLVLENNTDPRLGTHREINQSILPPFITQAQD